jgi:hypothetical protein
MRALIAAALVGCAATAAFADPVPIVRRSGGGRAGGGRGGEGPKRLTGATAGPPLRVVVKQHGVATSNCVFASRELAERVLTDGAIASEFSRGQPIWGRCYFPTPLPALHPGELVDVVTVDGKRLWEQGYTSPPAAGALSRLVLYTEVLRGVLDGLAPGAHLVQIEGFTKRRGARPTRLYVGTFRFLR